MQDTIKYAAADVTHLFRMYQKWYHLVSYSFIIKESQNRMELFIYRQPYFSPVMSYLDFTPATCSKWARNKAKRNSSSNNTANNHHTNIMVGKQNSQSQQPQVLQTAA